MFFSISLASLNKVIRISLTLIEVKGRFWIRESLFHKSYFLVRYLSDFFFWVNSVPVSLKKIDLLVIDDVWGEFPSSVFIGKNPHNTFEAQGSTRNWTRLTNIVCHFFSLSIDLSADIFLLSSVHALTGQNLDDLKAQIGKQNEP